MAPRKQPPKTTGTAPSGFPAWLDAALTALWGLTFAALAFVPDQRILRYKLLAVEAGAALALAAGLAVWGSGAAPWLRTPLDVPVALYGAAGLLFYLLSPERGASRLELTRMLLCAVTFFAAAQTIGRLRRPGRVLGLWVLAAALVALYALAQTRGGLGILRVPQMDRPMATFGNPIFLAAYLSCSLALALGLYWGTPLGAALAVVLFAGLWATQSRAALAGLGGGCALLFLTGLRGRRRLAALGGMLALLSLAAWHFRGRQWTHGLIWSASLSLWLSHPLLGCGLGRFHIEFPAFASPELKALWPQQNVIINFAHNEYLQVLAETGVVGLALLAAVPAAFGRWLLKDWPALRPEAARREAGGLALGAAALWTQNLFSPDLRFGVSSFALFFCLGAAAGRESRTPTPSTGARWGAALGAAALALWVLLAAQPILAERRLEREPAFHVGRSPEVQRVLDQWEARLAAKPMDADAAENLGFLYAKEQSWDQAVAHFELASRLAPERPGPLNNLGNIHYMLGDREKAISYWQRSLRVAPGQLDAHLNLGKTLYEVGRLKESAEHLQAVLKKESSNEKAQILLKKMIE